MFVICISTGSGLRLYFTQHESLNAELPVITTIKTRSIILLEMLIINAELPVITTIKTRSIILLEMLINHSYSAHRFILIYDLHWMRFGCKHFQFLKTTRALSTHIQIFSVFEKT